MELKPGLVRVKFCPRQVSTWRTAVTSGPWKLKCLSMCLHQSMNEWIIKLVTSLATTSTIGGPCLEKRLSLFADLLMFRWLLHEIETNNLSFSIIFRSLRWRKWKGKIRFTLTQTHPYTYSPMPLISSRETARVFPNNCNPFVRFFDSLLKDLFFV